MKNDNSAMSTRLLIRILRRELNFRMPAIPGLESHSWTPESSKITLRKFHMGPSNNHEVNFAFLGSVVGGTTGSGQEPAGNREDSVFKMCGFH